MLVEISPVTYITLCGLVSDALQMPSDAQALLTRALRELQDATAGGMIPSELVEEPRYLENLRQAGLAKR